MVRIMIGIPGSGKTTYIKNNPLEDEIIISPDDLRRSLFGSVNVNDKNDIVFKTAFELLNSSLKNGNNVSFDATNVKLSSVEKILDIISNYKTDVSFIVMMVNPEVCKERIKNDLKNGVDRSNVPDEVVDRMFENLKKLELPVFEWNKKYSSINFSLFYKT